MCLPQLWGHKTARSLTHSHLDFTLLLPLPPALLQSFWVAAFACTPGKWLMGLRVWRCSSVHYTRTALGHSIKVEPAGKLPLLRLGLPTWSGLCLRQQHRHWQHNALSLFCACVWRGRPSPPPFFPYRSLARAFFKASVSLVCPLIIFFISLNKGQTKYDQFIGSIVVDTRSLCREVVAGRTSAPVANGPHGIGQPAVHDRLLAQVR